MSIYVETAVPVTAVPTKADSDSDTDIRGSTCALVNETRQNLYIRVVLVLGRLKLGECRFSVKNDFGQKLVAREESAATTATGTASAYPCMIEPSLAMRTLPKPVKEILDASSPSSSSFLSLTNACQMLAKCCTAPLGGCYNLPLLLHGRRRCHL